MKKTCGVEIVIVDDETGEVYATRKTFRFAKYRDGYLAAMKIEFSDKQVEYRTFDLA